MEIRVLGDTELEVRPSGERDIEEEGDARFGPLHMLAASLATCSLAVLWSWAEAAELDTGELIVAVRWEYLDDPYRVGAYALEVQWPQLPEDRRERARRVVETCTVHRTLEHPPEMELRIGS